MKKSDAGLDWSLSATELERRVRAQNPWPVAETATADGTRLRVWEAVAMESRGEEPVGAITSADSRGIDVATGSGTLRLLRVQPPGGRVMTAGAYLNAHRLEGDAFVC